MSDTSIVITGIGRTPMATFQGELSSLTATQLGAIAVGKAVAETGIPVADYDECVMGCVLPAGLGQAPARQASLGAGIPDTVGATTVNKMCGSGMKAIMQGHDMIVAGSADIVIAGGLESMSNAPYLLPKVRQGLRMGHGEVRDHMFTDGLEDFRHGRLMGTYAEATAQRYQFTREEQDAFAVASLTRAQTANVDGTFRREMASVTVKTRKGESVVDSDEQPRTADHSKIPNLKPAFAKDGTVTPANSSSISDGAAAVTLMSRANADKRGVKALARIVGQATFAHEPEWFTTAPVGAVKKVLDRVGWKVSDVDLFEVNEAFAVVPMAVMRDLGIGHDIMNIHGGGCALGHPVGASGARIIVGLVNALEKHGLKRGVAAICLGGGEATALAIELA
ncbi:acetyl-CoA C-acyltransferase [Emcibacter sp. SYSU 3D8]|uniref:acetyl-CoA C-acyltransferase n=1 Tax=Emcibacter sp. SYSU 3D8 TaxID=3133969 RepID=UPI0031FEFF4A